MLKNKQGGFLIWFDEVKRASVLLTDGSLIDGFSDALSSTDWPVKQWDVCGLMFEDRVVTHWALVRKGNKVVTGKVRVEFTAIEPIRVPLIEIENRIGANVIKNFVRSSSGTGGRVPPESWGSMKVAIGDFDHAAFDALERLERLRDQSREFVVRSGSEVVAQQRDAVGMALDVFDESGKLRKKTLQGWVAPEGDGLTSFMDGLTGVRTIEDQLIARDSVLFPEIDGSIRHTAVGAVFNSGGRKLEVFNVNRTAIEKSLGVDLIYYHEELDAWTLTQYKMMERAVDAPERAAVYRPDSDGSFAKEQARMVAFRTVTPNAWSTADKPGTYRLCGDGFFYKLCSRIQLEVLSESLLPGLYLPRLYMESILSDMSQTGVKRVLTYDNVDRHITNTLFAQLVRDGWIGTRGISSAQIADIVKFGLEQGKAYVIALGRPAGAPSKPAETLALLGF